MKTSYLGMNRLAVSRIGLGCWLSPAEVERHDHTHRAAAVQRALELGISFFDSSNTYGEGQSEEMLGRALKDKRPQAVIATKFGIVRTEGKRLGVDARPELVEEACDSSLRRLGTDYIDLYYLHRVDPRTPIEETVGAMAGLVRKGKVRHLGICEASASTIRRANAIHPITAVQTEYSLWTRNVEEAILPACRELGIGFVAYAPLGRGFLTGQVRSIDRTNRLNAYPRFQGDNLRKNLDAIGPLEEVAREKSCAPAEISLAWMLTRGEDVVPIPGTKSLDHLQGIVRAAEIVLSKADLERLDTVASRVVGKRYDEAGLKTVDL
ncbi:MAG: aldo/keto reductase [Chloroflexi bacterium]|nr:aldo/keto reductase [Chloroflexota bacterium]